SSERPSERKRSASARKRVSSGAGGGAGNDSVDAVLKALTRSAPSCVPQSATELSKAPGGGTAMSKPKSGSGSGSGAGCARGRKSPASRAASCIGGGCDFTLRSTPSKMLSIPDCDNDCADDDP